MAMRARATAVALTVALAIGAAAGASAAATPDPSLTPGATNAAVTQETIAATICRRGYASSVRSVTSATKRQVFAAYRIPKSQQRQYVIDHLIPLEVGGANEVANLWPEPKAESKVKDKEENALHTDVCRGDLNLTEAQRIATGPVQAGLSAARDAVGAARRAKAASDAAAAQAEQQRQAQVAAYVAAVRQAQLEAYLQAVAAAQAREQQRQQAASAPQPSGGGGSGPVPAGGGPTAICNDGTPSYAAHHQGACSSHGGVRQFLK
jgi:hypothetical protein